MQQRANNTGSEPAVPGVVNREGAWQGPQRVSLVTKPCFSSSAAPSKLCLLSEKRALEQNSRLWGHKALTRNIAGGNYRLSLV